jgi:hypothetical protein
MNFIPGTTTAAHAAPYCSEITIKDYNTGLYLYAAGFGVLQEGSYGDSFQECLWAFGIQTLTDLSVDSHGYVCPFNSNGTWLFDVAQSTCGTTPNYAVKDEFVAANDGVGDTNVCYDDIFGWDFSMGAGVSGGTHFPIGIVGGGGAGSARWRGYNSSYDQTLDCT